MAIKRLPANLPAQLRAAGLTVVEVSGWKTRGRPGSFNPVGVLWHHTGSYDKLTDAKNDRDYAGWLAKVGRSDLPAPLCQLSISAEGVVYICASGRANHAGKAKASGTVAGGDGNTLYVGVECMNSGSQGWGKPQYDAMVKTGVVLAKILGTSAQAQRAHKETSVTGKWDPGKLDMSKFRADIAAKLKPAAAPKTAQKPALGKYTTRRVTNKRAHPTAASPVLRTLPAGVTVKITAVKRDPKKGIWFGRYRTTLGNHRWIPMRSADVKKKG